MVSKSSSGVVGFVSSPSGVVGGNKNSNKKKTDETSKVDRMKCSTTMMLATLVLVSVSLMGIQLASQQWMVQLIPHPLEQQRRRDTQKQRKIPQKKHLNESDWFMSHEHKHVNYHMVFSTSCNPQQDWESMVFFYHAYKVNQSGTVTRIVSGCNKQEQASRLEFFQRYIQPMRPTAFHIHFTPDYSNVQKAKGYSYKYMNKPFGLKHWMENGPLHMSDSTFKKKFNNFTTNHNLENDVVMLMDPDMILLRPMTHDFSNVDHYLWVEEKVPLSRQVVRQGHGMAQQDGYLGNEWMNLNAKLIFGQDSIVLPSPQEGPIHWNTGPPYLATVRDMYRIAVKWCEYAPRVVQVHPELFAEMFGFIFATVQLKMPFTLLKSLVVSNTKERHREGWSFIDALPVEQVCDPPLDGRTKLPVALHYCQRYLHGPMFFSKYRVKKNILNCEKRLLQRPPDPFVDQFNYTVLPPLADLSDRNKYQPIHVFQDSQHGKREAFMLCALIKSVNEALIHHKQLACPNGTANLEMTYTVYNDPSNF